jgi:hypothetical protein
MSTWTWLGMTTQARKPVTLAVEVQQRLFDDARNVGTAQPTGTVFGIEVLLDASAMLDISEFGGGGNAFDYCLRQGVCQAEGDGLQ